MERGIIDDRKEVTDMSVTIVGLIQKAGVYEGTPYDNVTFQCTEPYAQGKGLGVQVKTYKVKREVMTEIFGKSLSDKELATFIGQAAEFFFNEYGAVKLVEIQQPPK